MCESLLSYLNSQDVPIHHISIREDTADKHSDENNEEWYYTASRKIMIHMNFDMPFINLRPNRRQKTKLSISNGLLIEGVNIVFNPLRQTTNDLR